MHEVEIFGASGERIEIKCSKCSNISTEETNLSHSEFNCSSCGNHIVINTRSKVMVKPKTTTAPVDTTIPLAGQLTSVVGNVSVYDQSTTTPPESKKPQKKPEEPQRTFQPIPTGRIVRRPTDEKDSN